MEDYQLTPRHMGYGPMGGYGFNSILGFANEIIWLAVGVLLIIWLYRQVKK